MAEEPDLGRLVAEVAAELEATPHRVATLLVGSTAFEQLVRLTYQLRRE